MCPATLVLFLLPRFARVDVLAVFSISVLLVLFSTNLIKHRYIYIIIELEFKSSPDLMNISQLGESVVTAYCM